MVFYHKTEIKPIVQKCNIFFQYVSIVLCLYICIWVTQDIFKTYKTASKHGGSLKPVRYINGCTPTPNNKSDRPFRTRTELQIILSDKTSTKTL